MENSEDKSNGKSKFPSVDSRETLLAIRDSIVSFPGMNQKKKSDGINRKDISDDEAPSFDLAAALRSHKISRIGVEWFGDIRKLSKFHKFLEKAKSSGKKSPFFVATSPLEEWVPPWVGAGESYEDQKYLIKAWSQKVDNQPTARVLSMVASFWMSHAALGICEFEAVFAHLLMFIKMQDQHGQTFAIKHERRLLDLFYNRLKASTEVDVNLLLSEPCREIVHELQLSGLNNPKKDQKEKSAPAPAASAKAAKGAGASAKPAPSSATKVKDQPIDGVKAVRKQICFDFDPHRGHACNLGAQCTREHLDTKVADLLVRFDKARAAFKGKRGSP